MRQDKRQDWHRHISSTDSAADHLFHQAVSLVAEAALVFTAAGKHMLAAGEASRAITLLSRACELLDSVDYPALHSIALEALLMAQVGAGQVRMARNVAAKVDELECAGLKPESLALLRIQLAWVDALACEPARGIARVQDARALLTSQNSDLVSLALDAVECRLLAQTPRSARAASQLAYQVIAVASDNAQPEAACCAWEILGTIARPRDPAESTACFRRARLLAQEHGLPFRRLHAQLELGIDEWLMKGDTRRLRLVQREAARDQVLPVSGTAEILIAIDLIIRGLYAEAVQRIQWCQAEANDAGLTAVLHLVTLARSMLAAHQGKRDDMETTLRSLASRSRGAPHLLPLARLLSGAFCALLEEDREQLGRELDQAVLLDMEHPSPYPMTGWDGLWLLLGRDSVNSSEQPSPDSEAVGVGVPFWSKPFALLGRAVQLGRRGRGAKASDMVKRAEQAAAPYGLLHHLGLRMVAEAAYQDGWGAPAAWLRKAEAYFTEFPAPAVANACRSLLRETGAPAPQRRQDTNRIPGDIRALGVTAREFEVLQALVGGKGNKDIAQLLCISPRTVEKHIASLITKSGLSNRKALAGFAANFEP
jgi:DNA-binding CsgD family transcriptional regulator